MALNKTVLKGLILAELVNLGFIIQPGVKDGIAWQDKFIEAIADGVVTHITTSGVVTTTSGAPDGEHTGKIE
jgi:hypothetical protein